jgi:hypothetical protein
MKRRRPDPVTHDVALTVLQRDSGCVAVALGEPPSTCGGRLTLDHVKDQPRMGVRAPSDPAHLVALCENHHLWTGWATSHRPELREYLRGVA